MRGELRVTAGIDPGRVYALSPGRPLVLGRGAEADVPLEDERASRRHALVELVPEGLRVTDLGSRNGTLLDGQPLLAHQPASCEGGHLRIGAHELALRLLPEEAAGGGLWSRYERLAELGRGAAGVVFAARERASGREVAVKAFKVDPRAEAAAALRFQREARIRIDSPQVVAVHEAALEADAVYLVLERVDGGSLERRLAAGPLPLGAALQVAADVARGLVAAHRQGIVHRDLKPANVLLTREGRAKLSDFGIAKALGTVLTATGTGLGTLAYVPPEQLLDAKRAEPRSDLYGLGATLFHALAGRPPFLEAEGDLLTRVLDEPPPRLESLRPDAPPGVVALVHRLLEKEPADRLPNAETLLAKLEELAAAHA